MLVLLWNNDEEGDEVANGNDDNTNSFALRRFHDSLSLCDECKELLDDSGRHSPILVFL
jgi:hypothetical protein